MVENPLTEALGLQNQRSYEHQIKLLRQVDNRRERITYNELIKLNRFILCKEEVDEVVQYLLGTNLIGYFYSQRGNQRFFITDEGVEVLRFARLRDKTRRKKNAKS